MRLATLISVGLVSLAPALAAQNFGSAVAAGPHRVAIGEPINRYTPGMVHVFEPNGRGGWEAVAHFSAPDGTPLDRFGRHLSLDGERLLVGATSIDSSRGAAYLFERSGGEWHQVAKLVAASTKPQDAWGRKVLLRGDRAYVASWGHNEGRGAVAIWERQGDGRWTEATTITASTGAPGDFFGSGIAVSGDLMLVGAFQRDSAKGAAYVFRRDGAGQWREEAILQDGGATRFEQFGTAVAIVDGTLLVGAPGADVGTGAVFAYRRQGGQWVQQARLAPFDGGRRSQFGARIVDTPTELLVGAPGADRSGAVYQLTRAADGSYTGSRKLASPDADAGDQFGAALALSGDVAVVGSPGDDFGAGTAVIYAVAGGRWNGGTKVLTEEKTLAAMTGTKHECGSGGKVGIFDCHNVDLLAFLPVPAMGGARGVQLNDLWGWTDPSTGREYALVGRIDGTSFVDVTDAGAPRYLGDLPRTAGSPASAWRDIKTYRNYAFVVSDGAQNHGMQVFDLARLRKVSTPETFTADAWYDKIASAHNIVIDTTSGYAFAVGANGGGETCGGALHMIDIRDPLHPTFAGCFADLTTGNQRTGYTHDAQCVVYHGPDQQYAGRQICFNSSENALGIADVTDKAAPRAISHAAYPNVGYTHQGWLTDDQRYFYVDDELDEVRGLVKGTRTLIWDVSDLDDPVLATEYVSANPSSDHNLYIKGNLMFQSNYASGLRVFDISDRTHPKPVGYFDTSPVGPDAAGFTGSWSNYPFFKSGTIAVTSIEEGLFLLKKADRPMIP